VNYEKKQKAVFFVKQHVVWQFLAPGVIALGQGFTSLSRQPHSM